MSGILGVTMLALSVGPAFAAGTWDGWGQLPEPNSHWDTSGYMWQTPNQAATEKVYLNGLLLKECPAPVCIGHYDNNLDGNVAGPDGYFFAGVLGFWRDCNKDGYIGAKNVPGSWGNFAVYPRAAYTIDTTICPLGSPYNAIDPATGQGNGFIDEFRWIGGCNANADITHCRPDPTPPPQSQTCIVAGVPPINSKCPPGSIAVPGAPSTGTTRDPWDVVDNATRVWADWSFPAGQHVYSQGLYGGLIIDAKPPGTYADSDGTLKYVDDALGRIPSDSLGGLWSSKPSIGKCDVGNPQFLGGPGGTCGAWPLYQFKRLLNDADARTGTEDNPTPLVTVFDTQTDSDGDGNPCDDFTVQHVDAPTPGTGTHVTLALPDPAPAPNPNILVQGSLVGTVANVQAGAAATNTSGTNAAKCGSGKSSTANLESNALDSEFTHRLPTEQLNFTSDDRYRFAALQGYDLIPSDFAGTDSGVSGFQNVNNGVGWYGQFGWTPRPPRHAWGSAVLAYTTFYADVTNAAFTYAGNGASAASLPSGVQDKFQYGKDACGSITTGPSNVNPANSWECSIDVWKAKRTIDAAAGRTILGDAFDLRDVDCYDNTIAAGELGTSVKLGIVDCGADL